jgi:hypothetical protein
MGGGNGFQWGTTAAPRRPGHASDLPGTLPIHLARQAAGFRSVGVGFAPAD